MRERRRTGAARVLCTSPAPSNTRNPYVSLVAQAVEPSVQTVYFTWRTALLGRYDIVHAHWPESLGRASSKYRQVAKQALALLFLARLRVARTPIVRTQHNLQPHEASRNWMDSHIAKSFDRLTTFWIRLNEATPTPNESRTVTIPHGRYLKLQIPRPERTPRRALYFGFIREYKNVPRLVSLFSRIPDRGATLRVLGQPITHELESEIRARATGDPRVSLLLDAVPEEILQSEIQQSQLVVLPYSEMHNSGAVLLALSLNTPVLVPANPLNLALADEVGREWVLTYTGELTPTAISTALATVDARPADLEPDLSGRDWKQIGDRTVTVYQRALVHAKKSVGFRIRGAN